MQRALFTEEEVRLASERHLKYQGSAKVSINDIEFDPPLPRDLDSRNLDRICQIFRKNRCRRLDVENRIPVIVARNDLSTALQQAEVTAGALMTKSAKHLPSLRFPSGQLRGLHGRHRAQAGSMVLAPIDRWWAVDLYFDDISEELRTNLVEEYANQKVPTDGEIYRKIRQYEGEQNEPFRERWFVRLSKSNQGRLEQLDNRRNRRLRGAFDKLLRIPGIWPNGMRISMLHRLIATDCVEEMITYLKHIEQFWSSLVGADTAAMKKIDQDTVDNLQLLAPGKSRADKSTACGLVLSGRAFSDFSETERKSIWSRLEVFDGLVPSLYTFFEDFKYLENCAQCIKRLFGPVNESIWNTMKHMFHGSPGLEEDCLIQTSECTERLQRADSAERLDLGYRQVWLFAMRNYTLMPTDPKNDDDLLAKPNRAMADPRTIYDMADLARRLGFHSSEIESILQGSPDRQIARDALLQARKPHRFRYDVGEFNALVDRIVECFSAAVPYEPERNSELLADSTVKARARCGTPQKRTQRQDSLHLFIDYLHKDEIIIADTITTFFVRRCVYFAFFGKPCSHSDPHTDRDGDPFFQGSPAFSPLFIRDDSAAADLETTSPTRLVAEQPESEPRGAPAGRGHQNIRGRQHQSGVHERLRRRTRKMRKRRRQTQLGGQIAEPSMELDSLSVGSTNDEVKDNDGSDLWITDAGTPEPSSPAVAVDLMSKATTPDSEHLAHDRTERQVRSELAASLEPSDDGVFEQVAAPGPVERDSDPFESTTSSIVTSGQPLEAADLEQNPSSPSPKQPRRAASGENLTPTEQTPPEPYMEEYINRILQAREEQDRLEEELDQERLERELNFSSTQPKAAPESVTQDHSGSPKPHVPTSPASSNYSRPEFYQPALEQDPAVSVAEDPPETVAAVQNPDRGTAEGHTSAARQERPLTELDAENLKPQVAPGTTSAPGAPEGSASPSPDASTSPAPSTVASKEEPPPADIVEISFWSFERGEWRQTNLVRVDVSDPSPVERVAKKYMRKKYSLYDVNLQSLSPAGCFRAAIADGINRIFVISEHEESKLVADGQLIKDRRLLYSVSKLLDQDQSGPERQTKICRPRKPE
ncbi:hypothetical protein AFLA70_368g000561 [Aspergillus flavus AF70]|nr:hypothetical protein AFLA70_368g000561 [Aspergillus flavus AF70]